MNNDISTASPQIQSDIFSNMHIPEYDAQTSVATTSAPPVNSGNAMDITTICVLSVIVIAVVALLAILMNSLKPAPQPVKQRKKTITQPKQEEQTEEVQKKQQVIQTKKADETSNFATPNNITKCIRLFLETTRIK